jgi:hypothetical protein
MPPSGPRLRRVVLVGEEPVRSAPLLSLAKALRRMDIAAAFSARAEKTSNRAWLRLAGASDALVLVQYWDPDIHLRRQFQLARLCGCVAVRWWVGTDVLQCLRSGSMAAAARTLDAAIDLNIAAAPHLVDELATIGITAAHVPSVCELPALDEAPPPALPRAVLVYLPTDRQDFYGRAATVAAIEANPDLRFVVVGDEAHSLAGHANVTSLGWVEDMDGLWSEIGVLLRLTEHDGLPRMVLEALARSRHVIYAWPLAGCWQARTQADVQQHLARFRAAGPNHEGRAVAAQIGAQAGDQFVAAVADRRTGLGPRARLGAMIDIARCQAVLRGYLADAAAGMGARDRPQHDGTR